MFYGKNIEELEKEAARIANETTDDPVLRNYIKGLNLRVFLMEEKVSSLTFNMWVLIFVIFILPLFLPK